VSPLEAIAIAIALVWAVYEMIMYYRFAGFVKAKCILCDSRATTRFAERPVCALHRDALERVPL
jgi:hypothetical protein